jgi:hypothetical protein
MKILRHGKSGIANGKWRNAIGLTFAICHLPCSMPCLASGPGTTSGELLKIPVSVRAVGMGEAFTALADDSGASDLNPAGLAWLDSKEFAFTHSQLVEGLHYEHLGWAAPGNTYSYGATASYLSYGDIQGYNRSGQLTGSQDAGAYVLGGGMARTFAQSLSIGAAGHYIHENLTDVSAQTLAANVGAIYKLPVRFLDADYRLGVSAINLGPGLRFISEREPLPRQIKGGLAVSNIGRLPLVLTADFTSPNDNLDYVSFGSEYVIKNIVALRLGYSGANDLGKGLRVGGGIRWKGIGFDYAFGSMGDFGIVQRIGLSFRFGGRAYQSNGEERAVLKEAKALIRKHEFDRAIALLNDGIAKYPQNPTFFPVMIGINERVLADQLERAVGQVAADRSNGSVADGSDLSQLPETDSLLALKNAQYEILLVIPPPDADEKRLEREAKEMLK